MNFSTPFKPSQAVNIPSRQPPTIKRPKLESKLTFNQNRISPLSNNTRVWREKKQLSFIPLSRSVSRSISKSPSKLTPTNKPTGGVSKSTSYVTFGWGGNGESKGSLENVREKNEVREREKERRNVKMERERYEQPSSPSFSNIMSEKENSHSDIEYFKGLFSTKILTSPSQKYYKPTFRSQNEKEKIKNTLKHQNKNQNINEDTKVNKNKDIDKNKNPEKHRNVEREKDGAKERQLARLTQAALALSPSIDLQSQLQQIYNGKFKLHP